MFGGGTMASCKPISEADLARFMADCLRDDDKINQVLPIGGPGQALTAREQGEMCGNWCGTGCKPTFMSPCHKNITGTALIRGCD